MSPNSSLQENEEMYAEIKEMSKGEVIIMGDFNYGDIDWDLRESGNLGKEFLDLVDD